jgi:hypothetical protein
MGTCGTFAGKRPPNITCPVALASYCRAHQEHLQKKKRLGATPRTRKLQATPGQESYRHFIKSMLKLETAGIGAQRLRSVADKWKQHKSADQSLQDNNAVFCVQRSALHATHCVLVVNIGEMCGFGV